MVNSESVVKELEQSNDISNIEKKERKQIINILPVELFSAEDIKAIRGNCNLSRRLFAEILGVSARTVEAWELSINEPSGPARRMLSLIKDNESFINKYCLIAQNKEENL